jgi:epoxyqueuosine reductase
MPSSTSSADIREAIRAQALSLGFELVRFTKAEARQDSLHRLSAFLERGRHASMDWLARDWPRRADPQKLWPEAKSIVVLGANYGPKEDPLARLKEPKIGAISVYAQGEDYHDVLKRKLKCLAQFIAGRFNADVKLFVDTAPVLEKPIAEAAGLGWQGKHTNLVSRDFGSWLFLASVFTTLSLDPDAPESDHCGSCRRCLDICPTNAFPAPYELDARRCISYLTIEHKGHIPVEFRAAIGNRIYGCDDCLAICPWNSFAQVARQSAFHARAELARPRLKDLVRLDDASFRLLFRGSPIKRTGRDRFVRNVLIAIGNSADPAFVDEVVPLLRDPSALVRAMAVWALSKLASKDRLDAIAREHRPDETDADVNGEWDWACAAASR